MAELFIPGRIPQTGGMENGGKKSASAGRRRYNRENTGGSLMEYSALIVAAGSGSRMKLGYNKVYYDLGDSTVLEKTMALFLMDSRCSQIVVVTDSEDFQEHIHKRFSGRVTLVSGGSTRQESVSNGLGAVISDIVLIHDGARPYLDEDCLNRLLAAMESEQAACLMVPCKDTIKAVAGGYITGTLERDTLRQAQTPQAFRTELILACMEQAVRDGYTGTDDCSLVERYSKAKIRVVEGSYANIKITTPEDLHEH